MNTPTNPPHTTVVRRSNLAKIRPDKRLLFIFLNGIASGFPWIIIGSAMTLWLKDMGLTRTAIGFFGSVFTVYSLNWVWAPLLDRVRLPLLGRLGQRRSWLLLMQGAMLVFIVLMSFTDPSQHLVLMSLLALCVATASATQDVVIDAYRIDVITADEQEKLPLAAALATSGWWVGAGFIGSVALYLADGGFSWGEVYRIMALFVVAFMAVTWWLHEPPDMRAEAQQQAQAEYERQLGGASPIHRVAAWCLTTIVEPLKDFFTRFGYIALLLFLFIFLFKMGEAFLGRMAYVFYDEIGFSKSQIATYSKLGGTIVTIVFSIVASFITVHYGLVRGLMISGIAMASTNLIYAYMATLGPDTTVFAAAVLLDNFTSAFSTVSLVAFISHLTNRAYTATQYALMASMGNFGRTVLAGGSGWMVDALDSNSGWLVHTIDRSSGWLADTIDGGSGRLVDALGGSGWLADILASSSGWLVDALDDGSGWLVDTLAGVGAWSVFFIITALMVIPSLLMLAWIGKNLKHLFR